MHTCSGNALGNCKLDWNEWLGTEISHKVKFKVNFKVSAKAKHLRVVTESPMNARYFRKSLHILWWVAKCWGFFPQSKLLRLFKGNQTLFWNFSSFLDYLDLKMSWLPQSTLKCSVQWVLIMVWSQDWLLFRNNINNQFCDQTMISTHWKFLLHLQKKNWK